MKNKIISLIFTFMFLLSNFIFVSAITPSAKIELDSYSYTINSLQDVKISGTVSRAYGQKLIVKNSNNTPILLKDLPNANGSSSNFEFTIKSSRITEGTNTFQVQSSNLLGKVSASNPKTITITYKKQSKQNQVISVSDKSVEIGKTINLNASVNSGLQLSYFSKNADIATVDGKGVVTGKKEGTAVIEISQNGNNNWNSVKKEVKVTVTKSVVVKKNQSITANNKSVNVGNSVLIDAKISSGLKPTYESSNTSIAAVDANGKVTGKSGGTAKITITQSGNNTYNAASKVITVTINKNNQTITANNKSVYAGKSISLGAKASSKLKPTYKSSNTKIATVDKNGKITGKKAGKATITITQNGNNTYKSVSKKIIITVKPSTYTIIYYPEGGSGKSYKQTASSLKATKLTANKFKRDGYTFVGWATEKGRAYYNKQTNVTKFKNINMNHYQRGVVATTRKPSAKGIKWKKLKANQKQKMTNKCSVVDLAAPGKTVKLYAVWKGSGPQAAADWAVLIARDNNFAYGSGSTAHSGGCYYCGTNISNKGKAYVKTWCCNPFIYAAYVHGANIKNNCSRIWKDGRRYYMGGMLVDEWTVYQRKYSNPKGKFEQISRSRAAKPGDIYLSSSHVWMSVGNGKIVEATSLGGGSRSWGPDSIRVCSGSKGNKVVRYYPY